MAKAWTIAALAGVGVAIAGGMVAMKGSCGSCSSGGASCPIQAAAQLAQNAIATPAAEPVVAVTNVAFEQAASAYAIDAVHSSVVFNVKHNNVANFWGCFEKVNGSFNLTTEGGVLDVTVETASVDTNNGKRDEHLRGSDFFSAKEFPTLTFKGTKFEKAGDAWNVSGDLTARGVTKPITVTVKETGTGTGRGDKQLAGIEATFNFNRSEFGIDYGMGQLSDNVNVIVALEGTR